MDSLDSELGSMLIITLVLIVLIVLYFLPTISAFSRGHQSRFGIFILNLFLGWTFIFWVISLSWAFSKKD